MTAVLILRKTVKEGKHIILDVHVLHTADTTGQHSIVMPQDHGRGESGLRHLPSIPRQEPKSRRVLRDRDGKKSDILLNGLRQTIQAILSMRKI